MLLHSFSTLAKFADVPIIMFVGAQNMRDCKVSIAIRANNSKLQVVAGFDIVSRMAHMGSPDGTPRAKLVIADCGQLDESEVEADVFEDKLHGLSSGPQ